MSPPPAGTLNSNPAEAWTLVTPRRRRRRKTLPHPPSQSQTLTLTLTSESDPPSPWIPSDPSPDPYRQSILLRRIQSATLHLHNSRFLLRFLSRLRSPEIQQRLSNLSSSFPSHLPIQIVAYGIGSIESRITPRLQLALALLLKRELEAGPIEVFDPVLSAVECAALASLGCRVLAVDEKGRRKTDAPTVYYMPHCEAALYDNLLGANWEAARLGRMAVLGNSFGAYARYAEGMGGGGEMEVVVGRRLLGVRRCVREVEMEERRREEEEEEEEEEFYRAFHDISWHFFELDEDADMGLLCE